MESNDIEVEDNFIDVEATFGKVTIVLPPDADEDYLMTMEIVKNDEDKVEEITLIFKSYEP